MADLTYERVLSVKNEVFVYRIPARTSNRGYRAADWSLDQPSWTGRMRIVALGKTLQLKLEDKNSGELFAMCTVDSYPGMAVEQVLDSSRYFVIRIEDGSGRHAFIGIGFTDRADSFDLLVSMQDHFKWIKREEKEALDDQAEMLDPAPKLDLGFKEGQTITINLGNVNENRKPRPRTNAVGGTPGLLPPPPGGVKLPGPPRIPSAVTPPSETIQPTVAAVGHSSHGLVDFGSLTPQPAQTVQPTLQTNLDPWGDFTSASSEPTATSGSDPWVQF